MTIIINKPKVRLLIKVLVTQGDQILGSSGLLIKTKSNNWVN